MPAWISDLIYSTPLIIFALAAHRRASAELTWARRCDPKKGIFRQPLIGRRAEHQGSD